nr:hypothetical protein [Tanacetum cinerariifolium]
RVGDGDHLYYTVGLQPAIRIEVTIVTDTSHQRVGDGDHLYYTVGLQPAIRIEEQPLPPIISPTAESPGHVAESDPKEDLEEYEDDETEDGPVDYPMDRGDDGHDDDGDLSGDDADNEEEDEEDGEEEEHLALADSASPTLLSTPILNRVEYFREPKWSHQTEPIYPEYIPLEDEHILPAEEQPLPHVVSPTAESRGYVAESDPKEDPEEYEDDETEDGPVDYPMDEGDDDDGDSSRDDVDDEDEDEEDEEEEKHLAPVDSAVVIPTDELVSPPEGTEPVIP